ncbi:arylsulfatase [Sedimentisphaera salicampi]|uniref:Arylsulfatase n=1 Tax=Sedimentisphaera salicampi TaxID=1941349 RepID=A0A1W6LIT7_9BACT|nr:arylsulfatase [Sedimentisphaera salicampi]ARN55653.1 Arylsulfatase [Sedimentisphaera salicampi]OXU16172.1 Arylsulfatase [Sedimentisphaera salicampi]
MTLNRRDFLKALPLAYCSAAYGDTLKKTKKPNILVVLVDDMGYSDLGCYGSEISTPNIDRLAEEGVRFRKFYNTARCCPTRASLLTGQYQHSVGMGWMTASDLGTDAYQGELNDECITIAEGLKPAGYTSYMLGKWHVTFHENMSKDGDKSSWPLQRGFDHFYGHLTGGGSYYNTPTMTKDNKRIELKDGEYLTDRVAEEAVDYIDNHFEEKAADPMFMYLAFYAPHRPLQVPDKYLQKYQGKYMIGWDELRKRRFKKQKEIGLFDETYKLSPRDPRVPAWKDIPNNKKKLWDKRMAAYAGQIECMDYNLGMVLNKLKEKGELDNTLIMFLSDNGACAESAGKGNIETIGKPGDKESYKINWANASDTPFRKYKKDTYEGGICTPLIVRWPGKVSGKGGYTDEYGHVIDILPTCLDVGEAVYPSKHKGNPINKPDGTSLMPAFKGGSMPRRPLYWEHEANRAVRYGKWKLVSPGQNKKPYAGQWYLYDIEKDPCELNDLSEKFPKLKKKMIELWDSWAKKNGVYPLDNSGWRPKIKKSVR